MSKPKPDVVFAALADPIRCEIVKRLASEGPQSTARLLRDLGVTRQGAARHLTVLERSGLIESSKHGREIMRRLNQDNLQGGLDWLEQIGANWDRALSRLQAQYEPAEPAYPQSSEDELS